ncbi:hypothetical protein [Algibacter mikhailovii]|uniref:hypothetical protein n=1 Tax=Algibacter mikhailovii TaxID=425498 RepID=UPI0024943FD1|nr:hypothetical protein [Algibacter mikhailovii]
MLKSNRIFKVAYGSTFITVVKCFNILRIDGNGCNSVNILENWALRKEGSPKVILMQFCMHTPSFMSDYKIDP